MRRLAVLSCLTFIALPIIASCVNNDQLVVDSLEDVRDATIRIETQGTFVDPDFGLAFNSPGSGSGFIIDPSGIAVTNNHVVTGAAFIEVLVGEETEPRSARVLGVSECSDLAIIKIDGENFPYLRWYEGEIKVGMDVFAAGFPLGDDEFTLTRGIISKEKADGNTEWSSLKWVLEHDATLNPGNSGGPLITQDGEVLGINYAASSRANNQNYAIPAATTQEILETLIDGKDVESIGINGMAFLIPGDTREEDLSGIWISSVNTGSPADKAGIDPGDILLTLEDLILAMDGTLSDYCRVLRSNQGESPISYSVYRPSTESILEGNLWSSQNLAIVEIPPAPTPRPAITARPTLTRKPSAPCDTGWAQAGSITSFPVFFTDDTYEYLNQTKWVCGVLDDSRIKGWCSGGSIGLDLGQNINLPRNGSKVCVRGKVFLSHGMFLFVNVTSQNDVQFK